MRKNILTILLFFIMSLVGTDVLAYDFSAENADGIILYYNYINDGTELEVVGLYSSSPKGIVTIPDEVTYMNRTRKVTSIGKEAFNNYRGITSVSIPGSVNTIGRLAFGRCEDLTTVTIGDGVKCIEELAFFACKNLLSVSIPNSVTSIEEFAFSECHVLPNIIIPNSITTIEQQVFYNCYGLVSVTIPNSVTVIKVGAFLGCISLTSVIIPNSVTNLEGSAFSGCVNLTTVDLPNSLINIGGAAFRECRLTSITIPPNVISIGSQAFDYCDIPIVISNIEEPFEISGKQSEDRTFSFNTFMNASLIVPEGTIDKYKATKGWKDFTFIEEGTSAIISVQKDAHTMSDMIQSEGGQLTVEGVDDGTQVSVYCIDGTQVGATISRRGSAVINTNLHPGSVAIVKIGEKSIKVVMK